MGSVPSRYLIIFQEQHCPPAPEAIPGHRRGRGGLAVCECFFVRVCLAAGLSLGLILSDCLLSISLPFPALSLFYKKIGSVSVYKSITMATKAASKHLTTQLYSFLRHLGFAVLPAFPKHSYSMVFSHTQRQPHTKQVRRCWEIRF